MIHASPSLSSPVLSRSIGVLLWACFALGVAFPLTLAGLVPLTGLIGTGLFYASEKRLPHIDHGVLLSLLILSGLLIASSFWSITPEASLERAFKVSALFLLSCPLLFLCRDLPQDSFRILKRWAILPLLGMGVVLFIELKFNYPLYRFIKNIPLDTDISRANLNKHVAIFMLLAPFGILFAIRSRFISLAGLLIILCGLVLSATESQSAQLSVIMMLMAMPALLIMPHATPRLAFGGLAFLILFMPWIGPVAFDAFAEPLAKKNTVAGDANISMRLENWDFLSRRILERPLTGFGVDTTRAMVFDTDQKYFHNNTIIHPHNITLQIWIECGVMGVIGALAFLTFLYRRLKALPLSTQILPFTLFCGVVVFLLVSWSIWASWLDGLMVWIAALLILVTKPKNVPVTS